MSEDVIGADDVRAAAEICVRTLDQVMDKDWGRHAGELEWTAQETLFHVVRALLSYAMGLASRRERVLPFRLGSLLSRETGEAIGPADLLLALQAMADVLAAVIAEAPPEAIGGHVMGPVDRSGFAAMACDEMLVHTEDIMNGFSLSYHPPEALCSRVLQRLFPDAPSGGAPWDTLLWANGRRALPDHERLGPDWTWQAVRPRGG